MIYDPSDRYRQRKKHKTMSLLGQVMVVVLSVLFGYWLGGQGEVGEVANWKARSQLLEQEREQLQDALTTLKSSEQTATMKYKQLQDSTQEILGNPALQEIVALARDQLEKGMDAERLAYIVRAGKPPANCTDATIDRFVVSTPNYDGEASALSIADGAILISGEGRAASGKGDGGDEGEAWYDPKMPVRAKFNVKHPDADVHKETQKRRALPLYHTIILGDRQYRFTLSEGAKSFVKVTYDSCDYP